MRYIFHLAIPLVAFPLLYLFILKFLDVSSVPMKKENGKILIFGEMS
jgi:hypothetical protein